MNKTVKPIEDSLFRINLQLFAEGEEAAENTEVQSDPAPTDDTEPIRTFQEAENMYLESLDNTEETSEIPEESSEDEAPIPFIGGEPEGEIQEPPKQDIPDIQGMLDGFKNDITNMIQTNMPQSDYEDESVFDLEDDEEEIEDEFKEMDNDELLNQFYEKPKEVLEKLANRQAQEMVKPVLEKLEALESQREQDLMQREHVEKINNVKDEIIRFSQQNADFNNYIGKVQEIVSNNPQLQNNPQALQIAYRMAKTGVENVDDFLGKAINSFEPNKEVTADEVLSNEKLVDQLMKDENIKNKIITAYLQGVGKEVKPIVIGSGDGDMPVTSPVQKPKTFEEAEKLAMARLK